MKIVASESKGFYSTPVTFVQDDDKGELGRIRRIKPSEVRSSRFLATLAFSFRSIILPYGYPSSVSDDYARYQIFDTVQAFCSSLTGALATEAVMKGVGVGDDTATPLAAALTWLLKSGSGMVGQIVFTWHQGTRLDSDCKKWRFFADVVNDGATFIDLVSPMFPAQSRIGVFCLSSIARSLVGVAGGATRAAITQHQARNNNMADVAAKDGSQETLVNLVALVASVLMLPLVSGKIFLVWVLYITFTALHLLANYLALKSLKFESLNEARLLHCLKEYIDLDTVPTISESNARESVFVGVGLRDVNLTNGGYRILMGTSLSEVLEESVSTLDFKAFLKCFSGKKYLFHKNKMAKTIFVVLAEDITGWETVESYSRAVFIALENDKELKQLFESSRTKWMDFDNKLQLAGYAVDRASIYCGEWRARWDSGKSD